MSGGENQKKKIHSLFGHFFHTSAFLFLIVIRYFYSSSEVSCNNLLIVS